MKIPVFERDITRCPEAGLPALIQQFGNVRSESALFCNVHMLMLSQEDQVLAEAMQSADFVFADGVPVAWLQRRVSRSSNRVVRGYEMLLGLCEHAEERGFKVGFFGATPEVLGFLLERLKLRFPSLIVAFAQSPPFQAGQLHSTAQELNAINACDLRYLFVGLGCPKQEKWILEHATSLNCSVLGVGAAFDWLAGTTAKPPAWMERSGLGWLFRLSVNPRRLWRRYLVYNSKFVIAAVKALYFGGQGKPGPKRNL